MEQILAFALGVSIVIFVMVAVVAFKAKKSAEQNKASILNIEQLVFKNYESVNRRIDQEIDRVNNLHSDNISFTDSRVDKLEQKLTGNLGAKKILKG